MATEQDGDGPPAGGNPPFIRQSMQSEMEYRNGDVVISVPSKSGTTWGMNIVHQLRTGGDANFEDIYVEVPWMELLERPEQPTSELLARWKELPSIRAFKTHAAPPTLPFDSRVKYFVILRNPEEACVSMKPFVANMSPEFMEFFGMPATLFQAENFTTFFNDVCPGVDLSIFKFLKAWWPLRHEPNVCMIHFSDMKKDHAGSIRYIADRLGFAPSDAQWPSILEHTSYAWMKANESKFECAKVYPFPMMKSGGMVRKGATGQAMEDGMTPEIAAIIRQRAQEILQDEAAISYLYNGGTLPPLSSGEKGSSVETKNPE